MIRTCKNCEKEFAPKWDRPGRVQQYCSKSCRMKGNEFFWKRAHAPDVDAKREETRQASRMDELSRVPKQELVRRSYVRGFAAARHRYHYRYFLKQLAALLSSSGGDVGAASAPAPGAGR